ncbi:MAG: hypothetical protein U1E65_19185 [Myxococcota bacterium]
MQRRSSLPILCPSSNIDQPRAELLGVLMEDGRLSFLAEPRPLTPEFIEIAKRGRDPSRRFRFTSPCIQKRCHSWENERCKVADVVTDEFTEAKPSEEEALPDCAIRPACRWFLQRGAESCRVCPEVIAHIFLDELAEPGAP